MTGAPVASPLSLMPARALQASFRPYLLLLPHLSRPLHQLPRKFFRRQRNQRGRLYRESFRQEKQEVRADHSQRNCHQRFPLREQRQPVTVLRHWLTLIQGLSPRIAPASLTKHCGCLNAEVSRAPIVTSSCSSMDNVLLRNWYD